MTRVILLLVLCLPACATLEPVPSDTFYRLVCPAPPTAVKTSLSVDGIAVAKFESSGVHRERPLVFTDEDGVSLRQHAYHFWIDSPPELLQECLVRYLREAQVAPLIVKDRTAAAGLLVTGRVRRFERAVTAGEVVASVALELRVTPRDATQPVLIRDYRKDIAAAGAEIEQSVNAMAIAVEDVYREFLDDLVRVLAKGR